jgi:DNA repair protein RadC
MNAKEKPICQNARDAMDFWRANTGRISGFDAKLESLWLIVLDDERHFIGCHEIRTRFLAQPILFADELLADTRLKDAPEFILVHNRPNAPLTKGEKEKALARAIVLAGREKKCECVDLLIVGERTDQFYLGFIPMNRRGAFSKENPFQAKGAKR